MRFTLDSWHADYAFPYDTPVLEAAAAHAVDVTIEAPAHDWAPITPDPGTEPFDHVRFVDGTQSADAVIWIRDPGSDRPLPGLVATWAAGVLTCANGRAVIEDVRVERGVFSDARSTGPIIAGNLTWLPRIDGDHDGGPDVPADGEDSPGDRLRGRLGAARARLESRLGSPPPHACDALTVHDGLLHARSRPLTAVGLAKRAHRVYLPDHLDRIRHQLGRGQRSPLFATDPSRGRCSFYLALSDPLPAAVADPASCVARVELSAGADPDRRALSVFADRVAATLPRFASEPHQDSRAPQNLLPVANLESELRRLMGDRSIIRPLLAAQAAASRSAVGVAAPTW